MRVSRIKIRFTKCHLNDDDDDDDGPAKEVFRSCSAGHYRVNRQLFFDRLAISHPNYLSMKRIFSNRMIQQQQGHTVYTVDEFRFERSRSIYSRNYLSIEKAAVLNASSRNGMPTVCYSTDCIRRLRRHRFPSMTLLYQSYRRNNCRILLSADVSRIPVNII